MAFSVMATVVGGFRRSRRPCRSAGSTPGSGGPRRVAVQPVLVQREGRDGADRVADLEALHAQPDGGDGARRLVAEAGGQLGVFEVLSPAAHRLGAVQPQSLDADLDLALARRRDL